MGRGVTFIVCAAAACVLASAAHAAPVLGFSDDATKYADDGGASLYAKLGNLGAVENRVAVFWDPTAPDTIQEKGFLDRMLPVAAANGVRVVFAVYGRDPRTFSVDTDRRAQQFAEYLRLLARTYPQVKNYVVLNEPNEAYFWVPQRDANGAIVSAFAAFKVLAAGYDALKSVDPGIAVAGLGLSPDANDVTSTSPVRFLDALGRAYRSSGRSRPIMDELDLHFYPRDAAHHDAGTRYAWPNVATADVDRLKQAVWDAFAGTGQPVFEEAVAQPASNGYLRLRLGEIGWQVGIVPGLVQYYTAAENVAVTDEGRQAEIYAALTRRFACDKTVSAFHIFHLIDDRDLIHYQSGVLRADGSERPSFAAVRDALRQGCGRVKQWSHATSVDGAAAAFEATNRWAGPGSLRAVVTATEDANVTVALVRVTEPLTPAGIDRVLAGQTGAKLVPVGVGRAFLRGGWRQPFEFKGTFDRGKYAYVVRVSAAASSQRSKTIVSAIFSVV